MKNTELTSTIREAPKKLDKILTYGKDIAGKVRISAELQTALKYSTTLKSVTE
jgi:hypothetical protein